MYLTFLRGRACCAVLIGVPRRVKIGTNVDASKVKSQSKCNVNSNGRLLLPLALSIFGVTLGKDESGEDKLETMLKRSILCIQREQYDKAEQMLHLALRMAQDLNSRNGITYVYDVMANLAMEREQLSKAENLYVAVMKRLLEDGVTEDNPKILHISAKVAHIAEMQGDLTKSLMGFTWTIKKLEKVLEKMPDDDDLNELLGLTQYWFGQLLMKQSKFEEARKLFMCAYECFVKIHGSADEVCITILNNLSVACLQLEKYSEAKSYLMEAIKASRSINESHQEGILQANLGLILLKQGLIEEAKTACSQAWRYGTSKKDQASIEQAEYCLNQIKSHRL